MSSKTHLQLFQPSSKLLPRRAFTLIELTIVSVLLAIMAAVAFPKWSQSLERTKVSGMQRAVETDIAFLCRHSVRRGRATTISFTTGSATLQFTPPCPAC